MSSTIKTPLLLFLLWNCATIQVSAMTSYANDFIKPSIMLSQDFGTTTYTSLAQMTITQWARDMSAKGPWSVTTKTVDPPSKDRHDYLSWAPYSWPNCTGLGNTTELTPEEIWVTCPYYTRDGMFNPDAREVNDIGAFSDLSDAVFYNALAHAQSGGTTSAYSRYAISFIKTWFLDEDTMMNPHLKYAQLPRGPDGQTGQHTGTLDMKGLVKIANGIAIFKENQCSDWTDEIQANMSAWMTEYSEYLETYPLALAEGEAKNNHGSFYYSQLAAVKIILGDFAGATNVTNTYFSRQYLTQITADGEQPLEAARTRPYHYRAYNLAAIITNSRLMEYTNGTNAWNITSNEGATAQTACDWAMQYNASDTSEDSYAVELYPSVAAIASIYGDPDGKYAAFLDKVDSTYAQQAYFVWNQPLIGGYNGTYVAMNSTTSDSDTSTSSGKLEVDARVWRRYLVTAIAAVSCLLL